MERLRFNLNIFILFLVSFSTWSQVQYASVDIDVINRSNRNSSEIITYTSWSKILRKNSSVIGAVDYSGFKNDYKEFNLVLRRLATKEVKNSWSAKTQLAHWINVYNGYSIKLISDHFPARNLSEIGKVEKVKFFEVNNNMMSLSDIEEIIKEFNDVRALLVLHRGVKSGIRMDKNAYTAENLDEQLEKRIRVFFSNRNKNIISTEELQLSDLVKRYKKEIEKEYGSVKSFVKGYSQVNLNYSQKINYKSYDDTIVSFQEAF